MVLLCDVVLYDCPWRDLELARAPGRQTRAQDCVSMEVTCSSAANATVTMRTTPSLSRAQVQPVRQLHNRPLIDLAKTVGTPSDLRIGSTHQPSARGGV